MLSIIMKIRDVLFATICAQMKQLMAFFYSFSFEFNKSFSLKNMYIIIPEITSKSER